MKEIKTTYDTIAGRDENGVEYVAFPVYEDGMIYAFKLPSGGAVKVAGLLSLPDDAEQIGEADLRKTYDMVEKCCHLINVEYDYATNHGTSITVDIAGMNIRATYNPANVRPYTTSAGDYIEKTVITEDGRLIGHDAAANQWVQIYPWRPDDYDNK